MDWFNIGWISVSVWYFPLPIQTTIITQHTTDRISISPIQINSNAPCCGSLSSWYKFLQLFFSVFHILSPFNCKIVCTYLDKLPNRFNRGDSCYSVWFSRIKIHGEQIRRLFQLNHKIKHDQLLSHDSNCESTGFLHCIRFHSLKCTWFTVGESQNCLFLFS